MDVSANKGYLTCFPDLAAECSISCSYTRTYYFDWTRSKISVSKNFC